MADLLGGNVEPRLKDRVWDLWKRFACGLDVEEPDFGYENKKQIKFVALNAYGENDGSGKEKRTIETIHETTVTNAFLNSGGNLHGGCAAFLIDVFVQLCDAVAVRTRRQYGSIEAPLGTPLRIISTSVSAGGRVSTVRSEIWDTKRDKLVASGVHLKMQARARL
ncbi:hypothetical protein CALVIDRAFT_561033 [Calocera viscosa TUFC12733]|uniref:Thioesterase domain-containing protein n=1 Tax=Calocera viscosa (strain TUFC12733) TaxID=1330018 RepID=A0A167QF64_CALVF|nr:hypothetical protein CALVIDRAFT_561033 [Calocera viscosa TUFC12733]